MFLLLKVGAYAGLLLVEGNPLESLNLFNEPDRILLVITKDAKIYTL